MAIPLQTTTLDDINTLQRVQSIEFGWPFLTVRFIFYHIAETTQSFCHVGILRAPLFFFNKIGRLTNLCAQFYHDELLSL